MEKIEEIEQMATESLAKDSKQSSSWEAIHTVFILNIDSEIVLITCFELLLLLLFFCFVLVMIC